MDARRKEIEHLDGEIGRLEHQITAECIEIGKRIASADSQGLRNEELLKYLNSVATLRRSVESFRVDIERSRTITRQIETRTQEMEENDLRRAALDQERRARFVEIGAGSFGIYKALPDRDPYRTYFEDILKLDVEMEQLHERLKALEAEEQGKGFLERWKLKGRKVLLRGDINRLDRAKTSAYESAGARIVETDFARHAQGPLRQLFDFAADRKRASDALTTENDRRVEEIEGCRADLKRMGVEDGRIDERILDLEKRIGGMLKELDVMCCWTGQLYIERDLRREIPDENLAARYEIVAGLRESIKRKRQQIHRLRAEFELEEITRKEKALRGQRKALEEEMRVKERRIGVIDIELNMGLRRMEELRRVVTGEAPYTEASPLPPTPEMYPPGETPAPPPKP